MKFSCAKLEDIHWEFRTWDLRGDVNIDGVMALKIEIVMFLRNSGIQQKHLMEQQPTIQTIISKNVNSACSKSYAVIL
jgi:hypothetical protein